MPLADSSTLSSIHQKLLSEEIRLLTELQSLEESKVSVRGVITSQGEVVVGFLLKETDSWLVLVSPYIMRIFGPNPPSASKAAPAEIFKIYKNSLRGEFLPEPKLLHSFLTISTTQFHACEGFYTEARRVQILSILKTLQEVYNIGATIVDAHQNNNDKKEEPVPATSLRSFRSLLKEVGVLQEEDPDDEDWFYSSESFSKKKTTKH